MDGQKLMKSAHIATVLLNVYFC